MELIVPIINPSVEVKNNKRDDTIEFVIHYNDGDGLMEMPFELSQEDAVDLYNNLGEEISQLDG